MFRWVLFMAVFFVSCVSAFLASYFACDAVIKLLLGAL